MSELKKHETWWERRAKKNWLSWRPRKAMWMKLVSLAQKYGGTLADIGCGVGLAYPYLKDHIKYVGIDFTPSFLEQAKKKHPEGNFTWGDAKNLENVEDKSVTVSAMTHLCEHIHPDDIEDVLNEGMRIAEKALIISWFKPPRRSYVNKVENRDYIVTYYNKDYLLDILKKNPRFKELKIHPVGRRTTWEIILGD